MEVKLPNPKYIARPYEQMQYPGQRVQKEKSFINTPPLTNTPDFAIQRLLRSIAATALPCSQNTCKSVSHLRQSVFKRITVKSSQNDWVIRKIKHCGIRHKLIKPYTPRHNGKVERSHRKDNEYFYATHSFYSFENFKQQFSVHNRNYNNFPMRPLNWKSPADYLKAFLINGEVF